MADLEIIDRPSPNQDARPEGSAIDTLVLHYTGMESGEAALARLCDPDAKVSAHYCIEEDGRVFALVPEDARAWHAGAALWQGSGDINARSIGIELVNPGHEFGYRTFRGQQMEALKVVALDILARHSIPAARVLGHSDVAPLRKEDPGELFDWRGMARAGIGLWPEDGPSAVLESAVAKALQRIGYGYTEEDLPAVIRAFQRRYRPNSITGSADGGTRRRLAALLGIID
ncbi:MAG: N-acetylmuramoyl-L-alanine amidase [Kiloniellaceae bacterium]